MTHVKIENLRFIQSYNIGDWLSAKVYSDIRGNACKCGGKFTSYLELEGLPYPTCNACGKTPSRYRIRAKIIDEQFVEKNVFIRHNKSGSRLTRAADCLALIHLIEEEKRLGTFDVRKYESEKSKDAYLFSTLLVTYKAHHQNRMTRGEITPKSMEGKISACNILESHFGKTDIIAIQRPQIDFFKNSFTDRLRARDLALGELKTIMNFAVDKGLLRTVPRFDKIPKSKKREKIISAKDIKKVISAISDQCIQDMVRILSLYPVRPSELRALQWRDIKWEIGMVEFPRHFSGDILLDGRKSSLNSVSFPISEELRFFLTGLPTPLNREEFVFQKDGDFIKKRHLEYHWKIAATKVKVKHNLYELRHAKLSDIAEKSNGNIVTMMKASGHTNSKTLLERYVRSDSDLKEFFQ